jgi:hypothetical protein
MRLGTFVVRRPGILGLNDSLKRSKVYKVTFSTPQQQLSFDQQKTSTSAGEEKSWETHFLQFTRVARRPWRWCLWAHTSIAIGSLLNQRNKRIWFIFFFGGGGVDLLIWSIFDNKALYCATWCGERAKGHGGVAGRPLTWLGVKEDEEPGIQIIKYCRHMMMTDDK